MNTKILVCPACRGELKMNGDQLYCINTECGRTFPLVDGVPVLINEQTSVFVISDFVGKKNTFFDPSKESILKKIARSIMPSDSLNLMAKKNYLAFEQALRSVSKKPRVLVIGGAVTGSGFSALSKQSDIELIETDVAWGPQIEFICDIHDLPFRDGSFDGVVAQAVFEHVVDPYRGAAEIHRVLKKNGIVYAETPFMQQVHGGRYDFTRFTFLGHRRLFRAFEEISSGAVCGPGMALLWSWQYFWWSFTTKQSARRVIQFITRWTAFFWKYFDTILISKPATLDAASGYFFMGRKSDIVLSDRDLLKMYDERVRPRK